MGCSVGKFVRSVYIYAFVSELGVTHGAVYIRNNQQLFPHASKQTFIDLFPTATDNDVNFGTIRFMNA